MSSSNFAIKREILPLTSFRFLAAFYVFLFHLEIREPLFSLTFLGDFMREGCGRDDHVLRALGIHIGIRI